MYPILPRSNIEVGGVDSGRPTRDHSELRMTTATSLAAFKLIRVVTDPIVLHDTNHESDWGLPDDHNIYEDIIRARCYATVTTPLAERRSHATWPDLLAYCWTASMDGRYVGAPLVLIYTRAFREYLDQWSSLDPDEQPVPLNDPVGALATADAELEISSDELADDLRTKIKAERDRAFLDAYDAGDDETVPAAFWQPDTECSTDASWADTDVPTADLTTVATDGTYEDLRTAITDAIAAVVDADIEAIVEREIPQSPEERKQYTLTDFDYRTPTEMDTDSS